MEEVVADGDEQLQRVANMAKTVRREQAHTGEGSKPKKDRRTTMLGRFRRPRPSSVPADDGVGGGGGGGSGTGAGENAGLANYIAGKKEKKVSTIRQICRDMVAFFVSLHFLLAYLKLVVKFFWHFFSRDCRVEVLNRCRSPRAWSKVI